MLRSEKIKYFLILGLTMFCSSCQNYPNLKGTWKCTFVNKVQLDKVQIIFTDLEYFNDSTFVPIFEFTESNLKYNLGFGTFVEDFKDNYCEYRQNKHFLNLECGDIYQLFELKFYKKDKFCLEIKDNKVACFEKRSQSQISDYKNFTLDFKIKNDYFDLNLKVFSNGEGVISRKGQLIEDSIKIKLSEFEKEYIGSLIHDVSYSQIVIDDSIISGDYSQYFLDLIYDGKSKIVEIEGLKGVNFETKALIINLENFIMMKYKERK